MALSIPFAYSQNLPSLGDRISGTVSLGQEYEMGQQFLAVHYAQRRALQLEGDPSTEAMSPVVHGVCWTSLM